ncbi:MAG TPA: hypothetical protein VI731_10585 [Bacteroidia bacterium]|nr:hypothetical protein [Bacteroidia bacterium]
MQLRKTLSSGKYSFYTIIAIAAIFAFVKIRQVVSEKRFIPESYAISWDTYGYYLHLPATFIYHDPAIKDIRWYDSLKAKYQRDRPAYQTLPGIEGRRVNVYTTGAAVLWSPFFFLAHVIAGITGYEQDGLSPPYQVMLMLAGIFYALLGLFFLRKLLLLFFTDKISAATLVLIGLGTNLFYYATYNNTLPHILLFAVDSLIILLTIQWHAQPKRWTVFALGSLIGIAVITRPSEIVWVLVPLLWGIDSFRSIAKKFRLVISNGFHVLLFATGLVLIGSLQLAYWKYTTGNWISNNHVEGFDFFRPFIPEVLFSYKKGWLLYTPVMAFAFLGLALLAKYNRKLFVPIFFFFLFNLWIISSWECWWYAGSFGQRSFVQSYGLMALPLAFLFQRLAMRNKLRWIAATVLGFLVLLNLFQTWQIEKRILHLELNTKDYYWKSFAKTKADTANRKYLEIDRGNLPPFELVANRYTSKRIYYNDYESETAPDELICDTMSAVSGSHSVICDETHPYVAVLKQPYDSITTSDHMRIKMEADVLIPAENFDKEINFTFSMFGNRNQNYGYTGISAQNLGAEKGKWTHITAWMVTPVILHRDDLVTLMIWCGGGAKAYVDNVRYTVFEPKAEGR